MFDAILTRRRSSILDDVAMGAVLCAAIVFQVAGVGWVFSDPSRFHVAAASAQSSEPSAQSLAVSSVQLTPAGPTFGPCHPARAYSGAGSPAPEGARGPTSPDVTAP